MTYHETMALGEKLLREAGIADAKNDAWLLLAMVCRIDHTFYYVHMQEQVGKEAAREYESVIRKRAERIPLQYITGEQVFMGLPFRVNTNVLIPRQDTETLVEAALLCVQPGMKVMDMCTGSGCVLISIMKNAHGIEGYGYDISRLALGVAKENARLNDVPAIFEHSNLFEGVAETNFDMIVSNPPYVPTAEIAGLMPEVADFEPVAALDGHEDGLYFYREIVAACGDYLVPGGRILFEIGCSQGSAVSGLLLEHGFVDVYVKKDLAKHDRVVCGTKGE